MRSFMVALLLAFCFVVSIHAQQQDMDFKHLTLDDGLSHRTVQTIWQDSLGFMWLGTRDGLNRYDGYTFKVYSADPYDTTSLSNNWISSIHEDRSGVLWIGTQEGLNRFNRDTDTFTQFRNHPDDPERLRHNEVLDILEDRSGVLWIGTQGGLHRFDRATETFTSFLPDPTIVDDPANQVEAIHEDRLGVLWIGTQGGLHRFDRATSSFAPILIDPAQVRSASNHIINIFEDRSGVLWLGTRGGLHRFDRATETFTSFLPDPTAPESLANIVFDVFEDRHGTLWVGTADGLSLFDKQSRTFTRYVQVPGNPTSLSNNVVQAIHADLTGLIWVGTRSGLNLFDPARPFAHFLPDPAHPHNFTNTVQTVFEDQHGVLWVGTQGLGLYGFDRQSRTWTHRLPDPAHPSSGSNMVLSVYEDQHGVLWVGTTIGLNRFDDTTETFTRFLPDPADPRSDDNTIWFITEDQSGTLWIGTQGGLCRFNRTHVKFTCYTHEPGNSRSLSHNSVMTILEGASGMLWIGTWGGGLNRFDSEAEHFTAYQHDRTDPKSISDNDVFSLYEEPSGVLWVGTYGGGLNQFDPATGIFTHFTQQNSGLPNNNIWGILDDEEGNLWLSTNNGLSRFNTQTNTFWNYDADYGLQDNEFIGGAYHKSGQGELFFGGVNGITAFFPDQVINQHAPSVVLTDFQIAHTSVPIGKDSPLSKDISLTEDIQLKYWQKDVAFEFAALHFRLPQKNRYAYRLDNYDDTWLDVGTERTATYTNLPPGDYTFRVKAANSDGVWNEEGRSLAITILPPWWRTPWAYAFYGLLLVAGVFAVDRVQRRRLIRRERERAMQRELEQARQIEAMNRQLRAHEEQLEDQNRRLLELDHQKSRFFANISHEFRTPLTLLLGPLNDALSTDSEPERLLQQAPLMRRNAQRLLRLINQLLDLSKLEAGGLHLHARPTDLDAFLRRLVEAFASRAERDGLRLRYDGTPDGPLIGSVDRDKLEKVVTNLLSNALKFTPRGGKVRVALRAVSGDAEPEMPGTDGWAELVVEDTGQGIPEAELPKIFDRFYQVDASATRAHEGSGIGLALTKELVELHGGRITVESTEGFGTCFTVRMPLSTLENEEIEAASLGPVEEDIKDGALVLEKEEVAASSEPVQPAAEPLEGSEAATVLIVEDNADMRAYLRGLLRAEGYRVEEAADGREGLEQARALIPDLIISDIMMPHVDGVELCREVKASEPLGHVPVVLLTARAAEEDLLEGLEAGADDYLAKPFSAEELLVRTENLIEIRRRLRARFSDEVRLGPSEVVVSSQEAAFVARVCEVVEAELSNTQLTMEQVADAVGLSLRQVHRRLKASVGLTPAGYVRMLRMERAAQLLAQGAGNVSEVAYAVGYNDADYFSRLFKQTHGVPPSQYGTEELP